MAAAIASPRRQHRDVFLSVFPRTNYTTPTPEATPNIGSLSSPGRSFGGFNPSSSTVDESVRFNRAWSAVTRYLTLTPGFQGKIAAPDQNTVQAFYLVLESAVKELTSWYANEISVHFRSFVVPELQRWQQPISAAEAHAVLLTMLKVLQLAQQHYLERIFHLVSNLDPLSSNAQASAFESRVRGSLHTLVLHSFPRSRLQSTLANVMYQQMHLSLHQGSNPERCVKDDRCHCDLNMTGLPLHGLYQVGLGGTLAEQAFAHAVHKFLQGPAIERRCFEVDWNGHMSVIPKLRAWITEHMLPVIEQALASLSGDGSLILAVNDREKFISMAITNLGRLRTLSLFDYIKTWPASSGAIQDVWEYLNAGNQADKVHVCKVFSEQIQRRLLHAGASTAEVLGIYVNVIHAFKSLDSRGVLLEKVAIPIRNYLRARDDTVSIIAASFLADVDQDGNVSAADLDKICPDITMEVAKSTLEDRRDKKMLNWDDMEWVPDPIDAGPDYKSSKSEDVVAYILGLFEQDEFIKEITSVLAQHLLDATDPDYVKEIRLVELFKSRLDATKLQAAEVMLRDMQYSVKLGKRINPFANYDFARTVPTPKEIQSAIPEEGITLSSLYSMFEGRIKQPQFIAAVKLVANKRSDLFFAKRTRIPAESKKRDGTNFKAQVLSSFFWPQLRSNEYNMPASLETLNSSFENRFGGLGTQQKLQFRPALSRVSIRLDLEDRTIEESDVPGWRASVIDLFAAERAQKDQLPAAEYDDAVGLTPEQIMEALNMEEELAQDALNFWVSKSVLYRRPSGAYSVLERLDMEIETAQQQDLPPNDQDGLVSAVKSHDAMLRESAPMFETFIANMLRNQGPKEVGGMMGITSLLKMVLPTFTYGEEEVRWLLGEMQARGEVVSEGSIWKTVS